MRKRLAGLSDAQVTCPEAARASRTVTRSRIRRHRFAMTVLLWRQRADDSLALLLGRRIDLTDVLKLREDLLDYAVPFFDVGNLTATEHDRDHHFVFVGEKAAGLVDLEIDIVL